MSAAPSEPDFSLEDDGPESLGTRSSPSLAPVRSRRSALPAILALVLLIAAGALYYFWPRDTMAPTKATPAPAPPAVARPAEPEPAIRNPVEGIVTDGETAKNPLPKLDDSDASARDAILAIVGYPDVARLLVPDSLIRHFVATIDNLPRKTIATKIVPVKPVPGVLGTSGTGDALALAAGNADRYTPYLRAAEAIDARRLARAYVRLYPLFQQAYVELGYPTGYFNDRLIAVIDHLLAAPEPPPPIRLSQPKVLYEFADPALEDLSAGQKMMVRIGLDDELRLKSKLREIRKALASAPPRS